MSARKEWQRQLKDIRKDIPAIEVEATSKTTKDDGGKRKNKPRSHFNNMAVSPAPRVEETFDTGKAEDEFEVDTPEEEIVNLIHLGEIIPEEMTVDEKFLAIRYLYEQKGMTQGEIAKEVKLSRQTVCKYVKKIKEQQAKQLTTETVWTIGGEVKKYAMQAVRQAMLEEGNSRFVPKMLKDMVETLQSLGLLYAEPKRSITMSMVNQNVNTTHTEGYQKYQSTVSGQEENVENMLEEMLAAIEQGELDDQGGPEK